MDKIKCSDCNNNFTTILFYGNVPDENSSDEAVKGVHRLNLFLNGCKDVTATILQTVGIKKHDGMIIAVVK